MHGHLGALHLHVLELWRLRIVADMHLYLIRANGILHLAQILAQILSSHFPDNQSSAIVAMVSGILEGVLLGELQGLAILDEVTPADGIGPIVAVQFRGGALLGVHMMPMGGHLGTVLNIDGDHAVGRIAAAIIPQALVHPGVLLIDVVEDNNAILDVLR